MRIEFPQGVPEGCTHWLRENVGPGNIKEGTNGRKWQATEDQPEYAWFYERIEQADINLNLCPEVYYVPTITVKNEAMAVLFALRWA